MYSIYPALFQTELIFSGRWCLEVQRSVLVWGPVLRRGATGKNPGAPF